MNDCPPAVSDDICGEYFVPIHANFIIFLVLSDQTGLPG